MKYPKEFDEAATITEVHEFDDHYSVYMDSGWGIGIEKKFGVKPAVGDELQTRGSLGYPICGMKLNGQVLFDKSDEQMEEEHRQMVAKMHQQRLEEFEKNRPKMDADFDSLPSFFQRRIEKFRTNNPDFRVEYEAYELMCCVEAVKIAEALGTPEQVQEFSQMDYQKQKELVDFSEDHSGNSFGMAVKLAYLYLNDPESVVKMHGALAPLVGSEEYGCVPRPEAIND